MRHIILMRHGEAGFAEHSQSDFERPLTARGSDDARRQGAILKEKGLSPDIVLCSPAVRTLNTWKNMTGTLGDLVIDFELRTPQSLYQASRQTILDMIAHLEDRFDIVLVIGHNPGIHEAAQTLSQPHPGHEHTQQSRTLQITYTPSTMAIFSHTGRSWYENGVENFLLESVVAP